MIGVKQTVLIIKVTELLLTLRCRYQLNTLNNSDIPPNFEVNFEMQFHKEPHQAHCLNTRVY